MKTILNSWRLVLFTAAISPTALWSNPIPAPDFNQVKEILEIQCLECHRDTNDKGGLSLQNLQAMLDGGDTGPALQPGNLADSLLYQRIILPEGHDDIMPPKGPPLGEAEKNLVKQWIESGAKIPEGVALQYLSKEERLAKKEFQEKLPRIVSMEVYPPDVNLKTIKDEQSVIVVGKLDDDTTLDLTAHAEIALSNPELAKLEGNIFKPVSDGNGEIQVTVGKHQKKIPIKVENAKEDRPISFRLDVMPVFLRENCNGGACHGSSLGKDGFTLSIFGYNPAADHHYLTRQYIGRRINFAIPEESLLLEKAMEKVPHSGGKLFDVGDHSYETLLQWIKEGAPDDPPDVAKVTGIEIFPKEVVLEGEGAKQQLTVRAYYSDGTDRDITSKGVFNSNSEGSVKVDRFGKITAGERGEAFIIARYDAFTVGSAAIVIPKNLQYTKPDAVEMNYVDKLVNEKLHKLRIYPSGQCDDDTFVRRVYLDIVGILPTPEEYAKFTQDPSTDKRARLIDELLQRPEFTDLWVMKWSELLQIHSNNVEGKSYKSVLLYYNWLKDKIANNVPIDSIARDLLGSNGGTFTNPASNYYQMELDRLLVTENAAQVFMGMRIQCAQCHNHPFDRWTMDDYYGFAAFFSQIGRKPSTDARETIVFNSGGGEIPHIVTKQGVKPKFLGGREPEIKPGEDRRQHLANWMVSDENPFFARNMANIIWNHFFGIGIIEPVDDVRVSNPPSNEALLHELSQKLVSYKYDFRSLIRDITNSAAYQRVTTVNESNKLDNRNFAHQTVRRMRAEVLLDSLSQITGNFEKFRGLPLGARAVQIADGSTSNYFLTTFGRAERLSVCACEVKMEPNLSQALHLINGEVTHQRVKNGNVVGKLLEEKKTPEEIIDHLYIRTFSRLPTEEEKSKLLGVVQSAPAEELKVVLEDIFWALLNSKEFVFNH